MATPPVQGAAVDQGVQDPTQMTADGQTAIAKPLPDLIQADRYRAGNAALSGTNGRGGAPSAWGCTRPAKVVPPGTSYDPSFPNGEPL